ncbi:MAG: response regulator transcription factor [Vicinamibacterales bacterium]
MAKRILVVEDDKAMGRVLAHNLRFEGFEVKWVTDGAAALAEARDFQPDLVLLDVALPGMTGVELAKAWSVDRRFPVIMLTARSDRRDELAGLRAGADDYVTKPFNLDTLLARMDAVMRRAHPLVGLLTLDDVVVDFTAKTATKAGRRLDLTHREFAILRYLAERENCPVDRRELLRDIWGYSEAPLTRPVDQAILRLRRKIEADPRRPKFLHSSYGDGYVLSTGDKVSGSTSP